MSKFQRPLAIIVLTTSIGAGMQIARGQVGQIGPEQTPGSPTPSDSTGLPDPKKDDSSLSNALKAASSEAAAQLQGRAATQKSSGTSNSNNPNYVPRSSAELDKVMGSDSQMPSTTPRPPAPFVPSQVETVAPSGVKLGEPRVVLHTVHGDIRIRLHTAYVPVASKIFLELARGTKEFTDAKTSKKTRRPFYDGLIFHRVIPGQLIQGGCPFGNGRGGPGFMVPDDINPNLTFDKPGVVALAPQRDGLKINANSNGSQFFITAVPQPQWNGKFTIIGEVESGLSVVRKISNAPAGPTERPIRRVYIKSAEVIEDSPTQESAAENQADLEN